MFSHRSRILAGIATGALIASVHSIQAADFAGSVQGVVKSASGQALSGLATLPNRGNHPRELLELGNRSFREVHFKPYRIVYRVLEREVHVLIVADGRRNMRALLARRLLSA